MRSNLKAEEIKRLDRASSIGVHQSAPDLRSYFEDSRWLSCNNVYRNDPIKSIGNDIRNKCINTQDMREYIAVSIFMHLIDGWEYLGQALYAQVVRGAPIAIHLGYYAEMRATMSLLATRGIGIFDSQHFVVDKNGDVHSMSNNGGQKRSTHQAIWLYFEHWLRSNKAGKLLGEIIHPYSKPLTEWIDAMPCTGEERWAPVASDMLRTYGVDLQRIQNDRNMRNEASYRPNDISSYRNLASMEVIEYLIRAVYMLAPSATPGGFDILDYHILCRTMEKVFISVFLKTPQNEPEKFGKEITVMLDAVLEDNSVYKEEIRNFIANRVLCQNRSTLIDLASDTSVINDPLPLLSRAVLLLRLATGAACDYMKATSIRFESLDFWRSKRGREIGLWKDSEPVPITDLWSDVAFALEEIEEWIDSDDQSAHSFFSKCARPLHETTNLGRFAIMGLAS